MTRSSEELLALVDRCGREAKWQSDCMRRAHNFGNCVTVLNDSAATLRSLATKDSADARRHPRPIRTSARLTRPNGAEGIKPMWSDPIDSALESARDLINHLNVEADLIAPVSRRLDQAIKARKFEKREGRLLTPEDRW